MLAEAAGPDQHAAKKMRPWHCTKKNQIKKCTFIPPRNFHATREEILSAGKQNVSKITLERLIGREPIWGINSLSPFILS